MKRIKLLIILLITFITSNAGAFSVIIINDTGTKATYNFFWVTHDEFTEEGPMQCAGGELQPMTATILTSDAYKPGIYFARWLNYGTFSQYGIIVGEAKTLTLYPDRSVVDEAF